jgi:hypothetical protein
MFASNLAGIVAGSVGRLGLSRFDPAQFDSVRLGSVWLLAQIGSARIGSVWFDSVRLVFGSDRFGSDRLGLARSVWLVSSSNRCGSVRFGLAQIGSDWFDMVFSGSIRVHLSKGI